MPGSPRRSPSENGRTRTATKMASEADAPVLVVFVVSTIENEQPPEKAGRCVRFFNRDHPPTFGKNVHYTVLGLGDSNLLLDRQTTTAKDCNAVSQRLDKRLVALGATRFYRYGEADDRTGNTEVEPWLAGRVAESACLRQVVQQRRSLWRQGQSRQIQSVCERLGGQAVLRESRAAGG